MVTYRRLNVAPERFSQNSRTSRSSCGVPLSRAHETCIVAQTRDALVIVDQHAAHERIVYERLKASLDRSGIARQRHSGLFQDRVTGRTLREDFQSARPPTITRNPAWRQKRSLRGSHSAVSRVQSGNVQRAPPPHMQAWDRWKPPDGFVGLILDSNDCRGGQNATASLIAAGQSAPAGLHRTDCPGSSARNDWSHQPATPDIARRCGSRTCVSTRRSGTRIAPAPRRARRWPQAPRRRPARS